MTAPRIHWITCDRCHGSFLSENAHHCLAPTKVARMVTTREQRDAAREENRRVLGNSE